MTFDDFKKEFEIWRKIDTPEILEICNKQYQQHLLIQEDSNYFEPLLLNNDNDIIGLYNKNLNTILGIDNLTEKQICFLIEPSFDPESLLQIDTSKEIITLTHKILTTNYWTTIYTGNNILNIEINKTEVALNNQFGNKLFNFFESVISDARDAKAKMMTLDGTNVKLLKIDNGKLIVFQKTLTDENSKTGKVINFLFEIIDNIKSLDITMILNFEKKINEINKNVS